MVRICILMLWIWFELLEFAFKCFESSLKGSNLHSNGSNLVRMVRIYIWMLRIPFEWLGEASWSQIKSLCADLETAWVEIDQKKETLAELEEVVDVQRETLENAHKDLTTEQKKKKRKHYKRVQRKRWRIWKTQWFLQVFEEKAPANARDIAGCTGRNIVIEGVVESRH